MILTCTLDPRRAANWHRRTLPQPEDLKCPHWWDGDNPDTKHALPLCTIMFVIARYVLSSWLAYVHTQDHEITSAFWDRAVNRKAVVYHPLPW